MTIFPPSDSLFSKPHKLQISLTYWQHLLAGLDSLIMSSIFHFPHITFILKPLKVGQSGNHLYLLEYCVRKRAHYFLFIITGCLIKECWMFTQKEIVNITISASLKRKKIPSLRILHLGLPPVTPSKMELVLCKSMVLV